MKNVFKNFVLIFSILVFCFLSVVVPKASTVNVVTKTSDKLLGNFIESAYNIFYNRESDLDGFTYWYEMLGSGKASAKYFIEKFVLESSEFSKTTKLKQDFVDKIYRFILGRETDEEGMEYWLNYIDSRILHYYKSEYPSNYTNSEILTLRWNINDSPKVIHDVVNKIISGGEFAIRISFMNIKLYKDDVILSTERSNPSSVYNSVTRNINYEDNSEAVLKAEKDADDLQKELSKRPGALSLKNKILKYLGNNVNNVAVSFYDATTHEFFDINGDVLFKAGSTHKVPLNIVLYDLVQAGKIDLNDKVAYVHEKHYEGGAGVLQNSIVNNTLPPQKFSELSKRSLLNSDNIAANMLITGINQYTSLYREYGNILGYPLNRIGNMFSTNEMNMFLKKLYYNEKNNPYYKDIIEYLKKSSTGVRIGRYIPESIVANKYGAYQGNYHDIGIVFGDRPFILSIYTKDVANPETIISNIAKIVYER